MRESSQRQRALTIRAIRRVAVLHITDQLFQGISTVNSKAALARICVGLHDGHASALGILLNDFPLVLSRVLLVLGRHADVFHNAGRTRAGLR